MIYLLVICAKQFSKLIKHVLAFGEELALYGGFAFFIFTVCCSKSFDFPFGMVIVNSEHFILILKEFNVCSI